MAAATHEEVTPPELAAAVPWIRVLCWATLTLEGFDIVALSASLPTILDTHHAGIGKAQATFVTTLTLVGILVGAIAVGPVSDRFGRRHSLMGSIALFSSFTLVVPWAATAATFGGLRFVAGIGLGACLPVALTMMSEVTPAAERARGTTMTMTGYHVGAVLTSLLALAVVPDWHWLFLIGGVVGCLVLPVMWVKLPETNQVTVRNERVARDAAPSTGRPVAKVPLSAVLRTPYARASITTWVASFMGLLLVYGLNSWLPTMMRSAGYALGTSLTLLLLLNLGGVVGLVLAGRVGDARGIRPSAIGWFAGATVLLAALSVRMPTLLLDVAVFLTGIFVFSAQVLVYAWIARVFPSTIRGTALGLAAGIGRIGSIVGPAATGALVTADLAYPWGFALFAVVALLAVAAMALSPRGLEERGSTLSPKAGGITLPRR